MKQQTTIWQKLGLHDWLLKNESYQEAESVAQITPNDVFKYVVEKFRTSVAQLSFADRIIFYHEFIICFSTEDYNEFVHNKKGIFGLIVHESVKQFYHDLKDYSTKGKSVVSSANKWVFRFVSHPDYRKGDMSFIGKLIPDAVYQKEDSVNVTFIPRQTGTAQNLDINDDIIQDFTLYSEGYYELPYTNNFVIEEEATSILPATILARLEVIIPDRAFSGKKLEYLMKHHEVYITGNEGVAISGVEIFKIPSEWVDNPHLIVRCNKNDSKFYITSFGEKTILNEIEMQQSKPDNIIWTELPVNSRIVLNGIVGINIFK